MPEDDHAEKRLPTALVYSPEYKDHQTGPGHPESPRRLDAIIEALRPKNLGVELVLLKPRAATKDEILLCHTQRYYDLAKRDIESGAGMLSTGDTNVSRQSFDAALLAAGGTITAVDEVMAGRVQNAFCAVRPPGHHARPGQGMGFCVFNNAAIAARYAQRKHKISKVLIADWDVHHGNGTQDIFYEDGSVLFFSTHQWPLYPGTGRREETGKGPGLGTTMNFPVPAGSGRKEIVGAFRDHLIPAAEKFKPEFVIISAGFDSRIDDPLGSLRLTDADFTELTGIMKDIAARHAKGRLVSTLEGGYSLEGLAKGTAAHVRALAGE
ncbi:MAG: histone deacetylase [Candidatus Nealsonbacteria bacterium]|nr:histone deacetylase [Candidatus Nealsonbacteria bacterium]